MKSPAFSLDYFPSDVVAWSLYQPSMSGYTTPKVAHTPLVRHGSFNSFTGYWGNDPAPTPCSPGTTPPLGGSGHGSPDRLYSQGQSLSTSPETRHTQVRRSNSSLASNLAASLSRPFSSSSPPSKKKLSPVESVLGNITSGSAITW